MVVVGRGALLGPEGTCLGGCLLVRARRVLCGGGGGCGPAGRSLVVFLRGGSPRRSYRSPVSGSSCGGLVVGVGAGCRGGVLVA